MTLCSLPRLWLASALLLCLTALWQLSNCPGDRRRSATRSAKPEPKTAPELPAGHSSYTYIGAARPEPPTTTSPRPDQARSTTEKQSPNLPDSVLAQPRQARVTPATGTIPDLAIDLAGHEYHEVINRYGYVPAVKTRDRLLGKIVDDRFTPLVAGELRRFARRGRAAHDFPPVVRWRPRIAAQLNLAENELEFLFLVPVASESLFVAAQRAALAAAGAPPESIAFMRGHFDQDLKIVVDELVTRGGEVIRPAMSR